jgi:DNA-binding GntR family transcriptional regulator
MADASVTSGSFLRLASAIDADAVQPTVELPPSFPEHVQYLLETEIVEGRLPAGERVTEEELVQRLGISRTPIREAMRVLEATGLIVRRRGRGSYIAPLLTPPEAQALFEFRVPIEGFLTACAAERATDAELAQLDALVEEFDQLSRNRSGDGDSGLITIDSRIHWTIYGAARTDLVSVLMSYWGRLIRETHARIYKKDSSEFAGHHRGILDALVARDPVLARTLMDQHLRAGWDRLAEAYANTTDDDTN